MAVMAAAWSSSTSMVWGRRVIVRKDTTQSPHAGPRAVHSSHSINMTLTLNATPDIWT